MCGLAGYSSRVGISYPDEMLREVTDVLAHRGPDDAGTWLDANRGVGLAHRRLAILDLSDASTQPMVHPSGAALTYNGELYNYREIRTRLEACGESFATSGDVEVVLRALLVWGRDALREFCGMFALAYVGAGSRRVLLARDPLGIKPLLIGRDRDGNGLLFASELRALLASGRVAERIDPDAMRQYLEFGYVFDGRRTMLADVEKVGPGEFVEIEDGRVVERGRYYAVPDAPRVEGGADDAALLGTLREVVAEHLVADVPVGVLLSGGLDSSVIAALAAETGRVRTLSFGFARSGIDERAHARSVAQAIGSDHTEFLIEPAHAIAQLQDSGEAFDDLIADGAVFSTRLAYREARRQGLKVVLVGEGADELFGGYSVFDYAASLRGPDWWRRFRLYRYYAGRRFGKLFGEFSRCFGTPDAGDWVGAVRRFELLHQLPNQYVVKVDRASMAESVEARVPYLDRRVVAQAMRYASSELGVGAEGKRPLRRIAAQLGVLPPSIVNRTKFGIALAAEWLDSDPGLRALARDELLARDGVADRLGLAGVARAFLDRGREGLSLPSPYGVLRHIVWRLLLLSLWTRRLGVAVG